MVIPIVIGALGTVTKGLIEVLEDLEIRGRVEIIQTTVLLRSVRILRRVLETCCYSDSRGKPSANAGVKISQMSKIIIIIIIIIIMNLAISEYSLLFLKNNLVSKKFHKKQ